MNQTMTMNFEQTLKQFQQRAEAALDRFLPPATLAPTRLHEAMRYATLGPGKRVRPLLVYATGLAIGANFDALDGSAAAVEFIHAYSLIHDDLPAMDDDDLRRGRPTCHRAFDEATAILAGDALQALAFEVLALDPGLTVSAEQRLRMITVLAQSSGSVGMAGGQAIDLEAVGKKISLAELENMHLHKTGALIRASVRLGFLAGGGTDTALAERLDTVGMPDPDLVIRTAGELRLSNFLLWQSSYAELWVTDTCWPDFTEAHLDDAIRSFARRERRFGGLAES